MADLSAGTVSAALGAAPTAAGAWPVGQAVVEQAAAKPAVPRIEFLSSIRGAALIYIILDHAFGAVTMISETSKSTAWFVFLGGYEAVDHITAGTRLATLVFLTGIFLERSIVRGQGRFVSMRLLTVVWPLVLWGTMQALYYVAIPGAPEGYRQVLIAPGYADFSDGLATFNPLQILRGAWILIGPVWFLAMLTAFLSAFLVLRRLPSKLVLAGAVVLFIFSVARATPKHDPVATALFQIGPLFLFFWLGTMAYDWVVRRRAYLTPLQMTLCTAAFVAISVPPALLGYGDWRSFGYVASLPALPLLLNLGKALLATPLRNFFLWAGNRSLALLCMHLPIELSLITLSHNLGIDAPLAVLAVSVVSAIAGCWLIDLAFRRLGWATAVGFRVSA